MQGFGKLIDGMSAWNRNREFNIELAKNFHAKEWIKETIALLEQAAEQGDPGALFELYKIYNEPLLQDTETQDAIFKRYEQSQSSAYQEQATLFIQSSENHLNKLKEDRENLQKYLASYQGKSDDNAKQWLKDLELGIRKAEAEKSNIYQQLEQTAQQKGIEQYCRAQASDYLHKAVTAGHFGASLTAIRHHEEQASDLVNGEKFLQAISHLDYAEKIYQSLAEKEVHGSEKTLWLNNNHGKGKTEYEIGLWCIGQSRTEGGEASEKRAVQGIKYLLKAVDAGCADAETVRQFIYEQAADSRTYSPRAYYLFKAASDLRYPEASMVLGDWHFAMNGQSVSEIQFSYASAIVFYKQASRAGLETASLKLGNIYEAGEIVTKSSRSAIHYYRRAKDQSNGSPVKRIQDMLEQAKENRAPVSHLRQLLGVGPELSPNPKKASNPMNNPENFPDSIQRKIPLAPVNRQLNFDNK